MNQMKTRNYLYFLHFLTSIIINSVAPLMTTIQSEYTVSISQSALVPLLNTAGVLISNFAGGFLIASMGLKTSLQLGLLFGLLGTALFATSYSFLQVLMGVFFIGMTTGTVFMSLTSIFASLDSKYANYGLFHAFFGIGGIVSPLITAFFLKANFSYRNIFALYTVVMALILVYTSMLKYLENTRHPAIQPKEALGIISRPLVYLTLLIFLLYAGTEIGITTWSGNLFEKAFLLSKSNAQLLLSTFWASYTFGRIITEYIDRKLGAIRTIILSSVMVIISIAAMLTIKNSVMFIFIGLFLGPIFPTVQKYANSKLSQREIGLYSGLSYGFTGFGSMLIVTSMGLAADVDTRLSYVIALFTFTVIIFIAAALGRKKGGQENAKN